MRTNSAVWSSWGPSPQLRTFTHALNVVTYISIVHKCCNIPVQVQGSGELEPACISSSFLAHSDTTVCPFLYSVLIVITVGHWSPVLSKALKLSKHIESICTLANGHICQKRPLNQSSLDQSRPRPFQIWSEEEKKNFLVSKAPLSNGLGGKWRLQCNGR